MAVKVTKGQICSGTISKMSLGVLFVWKVSYLYISKSAHKAPFWPYAALLHDACILGTGKMLASLCPVEFACNSLVFLPVKCTEQFKLAIGSTNKFFCKSIN